MAQPAAYVTVEDSAITLRIGGDLDHTFGFDAPGVDAGRKSVLTFDANPFHGGLLSGLRDYA